MTERMDLLTDEQMAQFITKGYLVLKNDLPEQLHQKVRDKIYKVIHEEGNPGNNILPRVPEIQQFFETPVVRGALTSILGEDYYMHPHRHCHYNRPGNPTPGGGKWHKDGYWSSLRSHRPWWAILFYYTQDITEELGPTAIMPGTQYYEKFLGDKGETLLPTGKAGTMVLVHFDLWHKATLNVSELDRYMLKFQFVRLKAPDRPSWDHRNPGMTVPDGMPAQHPELWKDVWDWLRGDQDSGVRSSDWTAGKVEEIGNNLGSSSEIEALNAAYALGRMGSSGVEELVKHLGNGSKQVAERASYGLQPAGAQAIPFVQPLLSHPDDFCRGLACFVIGMMGPAAREAVPSLVSCLEDESEWVRRNAVEALGMIGKPYSVSVQAVTETLQRSVEQEADEVALNSGDMYVGQQKYIINKVGYTAALSLLRIGKYGEEEIVIRGLEQALTSRDRYVRAYASEALTQLRTDKAVEVLIRYYRTSRWCPDTSKASTF
ncbi:HEAT repeat domain-containing protein [Paenibacillus aurantius]|uniref:HEAT repeat domain-containing protein n=1 Tax=Paenibacillus aurantius TaxID=2918900 RepID=A0AA96RI29_9BACL|nr:HEAT repeat domain-containing protein [Paenibacillus aurantius]WNQ14008.1 HEAT repeat domain-containing protein [Paenibacillus aurantius]